jgi:hypothetical protein
MATLTPHPDDTLGAMLAAIAASFTVFVYGLASSTGTLDTEPTIELLSHNMPITVS